MEEEDEEHGLYTMSRHRADWGGISERLPRAVSRQPLDTYVNGDSSSYSPFTYVPLAYVCARYRAWLA